MTLLLQLVANGLVVGGLLGLVALGLALIFGVMRVVNFAHGEFVTLGAFATYVLVTSLGLQPLLSIPFAFAIGAAVGALVQSAVISRTAGRPELDVLMTTYALSIIALGLFSQGFGGDFRSYSEGPRGTLDLGGVIVGWRSFAVLIVCLTFGGATILIMRSARIGIAMRALAQNRDAAATSGIDVRRSELAAFSLAVALAATAGSLISMIGTVTPNVGHEWVLDAFVVVVLGGLGSIAGAIIAAISLGLIHSFASFFFDDSWAKILTYALLYATLLVRPQGLLGRAGVGSYYGPLDAQHIFDELWDGALLCKPLKIDVTFYCYRCGGMATGKTCPHDTKHHLSVSGTRQREMLSRGDDVPIEFSRPEMIAILREYYRGLGGARATTRVQGRPPK